MAMVLEFVDGCSHYDAATILQKWHSGSATKSGTTPHGTGESLLSPNLLRRNFVAVAEVIVAGTFRLPSLASTQGVVRIFDGTTSTVQLELGVQTTGVVRVFRGGIAGTAIGAVGPTLSTDTWYYYEFGALIANAGGTVDVRIYDTSGTLLGTIASTALDTQQSAVATADAIVLHGTGNFHKDILLWTGTAYSTADFNGPQKIETLRPAAAGPDAQWTIGGTAPAATNHESQDEVNADESTTLVSSNTATQRDTYEYEELDPSISIVHAVQMAVQWRKDDTATRGAKLSYRNAGGSYFDSAEYTLPADWTIDLRTMELNPDTGVAWTRSNVNDGFWGELLST